MDNWFDQLIRALDAKDPRGVLDAAWGRLREQAEDVVTTPDQGDRDEVLLNSLLVVIAEGLSK